MKKIKNISHARIAEHMKQLKNAEIPEHAGTAEHFRNEWKYLTVRVRRNYWNFV